MFDRDRVFFLVQRQFAGLSFFMPSPIVLFRCAQIQTEGFTSRKGGRMAETREIPVVWLQAVTCSECIQPEFLDLPLPFYEQLPREPFLVLRKES